ncbi:PREDICTED: uncharacterized protein LOC105562113 [Vollenhovia emeryi]|uniref:uncharacterized protein LOC105562113 n=1 Tax=Vollenhovia emeryi TaxID=411798 RepID=UPI0005F46856|nr:PREDICTED: uncharacterized protein LOC105562113 [Vollenhovia emeryi]
MHNGFAIMRTRSAIIGLLLLLVTAHCNGLQYQSLDPYANGEECALILDARGRTSVYDYTYNLLRGSFPTAGGTCITYDAVNHAYVEARKRINVARPKSELWRPVDLATVGELLLDITTNIAQTYGLTYEEIQRSLPLIDTSKTLIREVCPAFLSNVECRPGKYRRYDGLCTNLQNPTWGATLSPFTRLMSPQFADGLTAPRISVTGRDLPLSRVVSRTMHPDEGYHDHAGTVMVIAWGQFMDHDYTLTATPLDPLNRNDPEECCGRPPHLKNPYCNEILIPEDDYFYRLFNVQCMDFVRAFPAVRPGCRLGSRVPFNLLTGVLDGNTVYGITEAFARKLRTGYGGLLRMNPVFAEYGLKDLLPLKLDIPDEGCTRPNRSMYCFEAGNLYFYAEKVYAKYSTNIDILSVTVNIKTSTVIDAFAITGRHRACIGMIISTPIDAIRDTIMKSAQAAADNEIKPTLQQVYIKKFNRKLKSMGKAAANGLKKKPSKPWWTYPYSAGWKKFTQRLQMPQKKLRQEKIFNEHTTPTFSPVNSQNKNLSLDMEIIKITTVVEAVRQKRQNRAQVLEAVKNIQKIIGKKRSKRSSFESGNNLAKDSRHTNLEKTFVSSKKSRYSKPNYRKQQTRTPPTGRRLESTNTADLKTANNVAIPSTVFYKRIWEYINGTRPHSDIIGDYSPLENNSEETNSTCTDKDRLAASQSQEDKLQVTSPKPERAFYKRIWDIINATRLNVGAAARFKRNAGIPKSNAASTPLCVQEETVNYEKSKRVQATDEETAPGITDTINSPQVSDSGPYISGFWSVANKTQWQPRKIPVVNLVKLSKFMSNDPNLSSLINSASEVEDLNKLPDKVERVAHSSSDNSTGYSSEVRDSSQEIITEPGPPYSSEESLATSSLTPAKSADEDSREEDQAERAANYSTSTTPKYDPSNIPYVEVPDYSDQQEDSLDKSNQNATAAKYKEYDDGDYDYGSKRPHDADDFSSKSPSAEIKAAQAESNEPETPLNANNSRSSCTESKDSAECVDNYDVEDTKLRNNTEDVTNEDNHSFAEAPGESALSEENENSDFVDFDINEYKKPFDYNEFFKNDPILKSIRATLSKEYDYKEPDRTEESEEVETHATDPKEKSHNYFAKNEDSHDDRGVALSNEAKEEADFYARKEARESEAIDKHPHPYDDKDFFKHIFGKGKERRSEYNPKEDPDRTEKSEEVETYTTDVKEHKESPDRIKESEEIETYATTDPKEQSQDYFVKNEDHRDNHRITSDDKDETNDREEENDGSYARKETKESEPEEDPYNDKDFFKHIFEKDDDQELFDTANTENEFLSRHFTEDVLRQLRDNSTTEEDRRREESRNKEDIHKTLSRILDKKDRFSRLDDNLNKMIEKGEAIPIKYNNFWSLKYESPGKRNEDNEEQTEDSREEA